MLIVDAIVFLCSFQYPLPPRLRARRPLRDLLVPREREELPLVYRLLEMRLHEDGGQDSRPLPLSVQPFFLALRPAPVDLVALPGGQGAEVIVGEAEAPEGYTQGLLDGR